MFEGRHYQNAYVTRDLDAAVAAFSARARVDREMRHEGSFELWTPQGRGSVTQRLAFLWVGGLQYELIEPVDGLVGIYRDALPADRSLRFHHAATRVADWDDFRARVDAQSFPVVLEGGGEALRFLYLDARPLLGHYLEYVWMTPERWTAMGGL